MSLDPEPEQVYPENLPLPAGEDHPDLVGANARAGMWLFGVYLMLYAGFVGLSAFAPGFMAREMLGGVNLAILYGMALIAAAVVLAFVYMGLCRRISDRHESEIRGR
jgi:uncharacterized membrane protein (DUF485 family)